MSVEAATLVYNSKIITRMENAQINARLENAKIIGRLIRERGGNQPVIIPRSGISGEIRHAPAGLQAIEHAQAVESLRAASQMFAASIREGRQEGSNAPSISVSLRGVEETQSPQNVDSKGSLVDRTL